MNVRSRFQSLLFLPFAALLAACAGGAPPEPGPVVTPSAEAALGVAFTCAVRAPTPADGEGAAFRGAVDTPARRGELFRLLEARRGSVVVLDLRLTDTQLADLPLDSEKMYVDLDHQPLATEGAELLVDLSGGCASFSVERRPGAGALAGRFRVREVSGPRMGIMSVVLVPAER